MQLDSLSCHFLRNSDPFAGIHLGWKLNVNNKITIQTKINEVGEKMYHVKCGYDKLHRATFPDIIPPTPCNDGSLSTLTIVVAKTISDVFHYVHYQENII